MNGLTGLTAAFLMRSTERGRRDRAESEVKVVRNSARPGAEVADKHLVRSGALDRFARHQFPAVENQRQADVPHRGRKAAQPLVGEVLP